jgi:serine/threonine protein kinase/Flp pilus assembly protein TadD
MSPHSADRNLLLGIIALQMDFISRDALIAAIHAWVLNKGTSLSQILVDQGALTAMRRSVLDALVDEHVKLHDGDPQKSLAALRPNSSVRQDLSQIVDPDLQASLPHVSVSRSKEEPLDDPLRTLAGGGEQPAAGGARFRYPKFHARGGLGQVSLAIDTELDRPVALKELQERHADDQNSRARFVAEAEITGKLEHPGVIPVYSLGHDASGRPFYAMRFIKGDTLKEAIEAFHGNERLKRARGARATRLRDLLRRFVDVCNAIAYAHSRGVLHRDLKPANIMLGPYGETLVLDWGLAKPIGAPSAEHECGASAGEMAALLEAPIQLSGQSGSWDETVAGLPIGTPAFASPEQVTGAQDRVGPASDVYGLGATLYALLTGHPPVTSTDTLEVIRRVERGDIPAPRSLNPSISPALDAICRKAMALEPANRYISPSTLADDVTRWLDDRPVAAYRESWSQRLSRWSRRHRAWAQAGVAALLIVAIVASTAAVAIAAAHRNTALALKSEQAVSKFYEDHVLSAARPKGWFGGGGKDLTLKETLDQAVANIDKAFAGEPELEAEVRQTLGMTYHYLGKFDAANPLLEKAYAIRLEQLGPDHPDTLASLHDLATQRWRQDKPKEARDLARQALEKRRRVLGAEHEDTLMTELFLGLFLYEIDALDEAEATLRHAIEICKRRLGPYHHHTLHGQNDLALVVGLKGNLDEELSLERQTLEGRGHSLGPEHPDTLRSMANLAVTLQAVGRLDEAETLCRQSLEARRRVIGAEHIETLWAELNLGQIIAKKGEYGDAEKLLRHCLETGRRTLGPEHSWALTFGNALANVLSDEGKLDEAEMLGRQTLDSRRRVLGPEALATLVSQFSLAGILGERGGLDEAERMYRQTLEVERRVRGPENPSTLTTQHSLAWAIEKRGRLNEAERLYRQTLESQQRVLGPENPATLGTQRNLARVLAARGKLDEAEKLCRQTLESQRRLLGPETLSTLITQNSFAAVLGDSGKLDEAETLCRQTLESQRRLLGAENPYTLRTMKILADALRDRGQSAEAERLFREVLTAERKRLDPDHLDLAETLAGLGSVLTKHDHPAEADALLRECLAIREKKLPAGHWQVYSARSLLGGSLARQGKFVEAEKLLLASFEGLSKSEGSPPRRIREALDRLIELYEKSGKPERAQVWRNKRPETPDSRPIRQ